MSPSFQFLAGVCVCAFLLGERRDCRGASRGPLGLLQKPNLIKEIKLGLGARVGRSEGCTFLQELQRKEVS